ncbi:MAG: hypothetical protein WAT71_10155 [Ignavibacteria bacterium]
MEQNNLKESLSRRITIPDFPVIKNIQMKITDQKELDKRLSELKKLLTGLLKKIEKTIRCEV